MNRHPLSLKGGATCFLSVLFIKHIKIKMKAIRMLDTTAGLRFTPTPIGQLAETVKRDDDMSIITVMMAMVMMIYML